MDWVFRILFLDPGLNAPVIGLALFLFGAAIECGSGFASLEIEKGSHCRACEWQEEACAAGL